MRFVLIAMLMVTTTVWAQNAPSPAPAPTPAPAAKPAMPPRAVQIEQAVHALASAPTNTSLWPGFDPLKIPLAVFDGKDTWLFRHPAPPAGFVSLSSQQGAFVKPGRLDGLVANSSADIGGIATGTLIVDPKTERGNVEWAAIAVHEAFHVFQRAKHPGWIANEADLFVYPVDDAALLSLRRLETSALQQALATEDRDTSSCWARLALNLRNRRYAAMDAAFAAYERGTELNEGLAAYVQMQAQGQFAIDWPPQEYAPAQVRQRAYTLGAAQAMLLDRFAPRWREDFEANDKQTLDGALTRALGAGRVCAFEPALIASEDEIARNDIAALQKQRQSALQQFKAKPGIMKGTEKPDYAAAVDLLTRAAISRRIPPRPCRASAAATTARSARPTSPSCTRCPPRARGSQTRARDPAVTRRLDRLACAGRRPPLAKNARPPRRALALRANPDRAEDQHTSHRPARRAAVPRLARTSPPGSCPAWPSVADRSGSEINHFRLLPKAAAGPQRPDGQPTDRADAGRQALHAAATGREALRAALRRSTGVRAASAQRRRPPPAHDDRTIDREHAGGVAATQIDRDPPPHGGPSHATMADRLRCRVETPRTSLAVAVPCGEEPATAEAPCANARLNPRCGLCPLMAAYRNMWVATAAS